VKSFIELLKIKHWSFEPDLRVVEVSLKLKIVSISQEVETTVAALGLSLNQRSFSQAVRVLTFR